MKYCNLLGEQLWKENEIMRKFNELESVISRKPSDEQEKELDVLENVCVQLTENVTQTENVTENVRKTHRKKRKQSCSDMEVEVRTGGRGKELQKFIFKDAEAVSTSHVSSAHQHLPRFLNDGTELPFMYRKLTKEEVTSMLSAVNDHENWISEEIIKRPSNGTIIFVPSSVNINNDKFMWRKKTGSKYIQETHLELMKDKKSCGVVLGRCHSSVLYEFQRTRYWLHKKPGITLVHYLNAKQETCLVKEMKINSEDCWDTENLVAEVTPMVAGYGVKENIMSMESLLEKVAEHLMKESTDEKPRSERDRIGEGIDDLLNFISGDCNEIICSRFGISLRRSDLRMLCQGKWLNDQVVKLLFPSDSQRKKDHKELFTLLIHNFWRVACLQEENTNLMHLFVKSGCCL